MDVNSTCLAPAKGNAAQFGARSIIVLARSCNMSDAVWKLNCWCHTWTPVHVQPTSWCVDHASGLQYAQKPWKNLVHCCLYDSKGCAHPLIPFFLSSGVPWGCLGVSRGPWEALGVPWGCLVRPLGFPWGSLGVTLGVPWGSRGGPLTAWKDFGGFGIAFGNYLGSQIEFSNITFWRSLRTCNF